MAGKLAYSANQQQLVIVCYKKVIQCLFSKYLEAVANPNTEWNMPKYSLGENIRLYWTELLDFPSLCPQIGLLHFAYARYVAFSWKFSLGSAENGPHIATAT